MNRRNFLAGAATSVVAAERVLGANDRIRIGLIGTGGRCGHLADLLKTLPGNEVLYACDVYEPRRLAVAEKMGPQAKPVPDYRAVLDDKNVDAVVIGAPDHWHTALILEAIAAGKDVYCEKPVTHTVEEGPKLIEAVEKSNRVVATGTQQRSWEHYFQAKEIVQSGGIGQVTLAQCYWYQNYLHGATRAPAIDPTKLDWKRWLGSAPDQPFDSLKYRRWRWFWDFGGGAFTDLMTHWIDVIQWFMNSPKAQTVMASGAINAVKELQCPDTVNACMQFPNYTAVYYGTMTGALEDGGIIFRGTDAMMKLTRQGFTIWREGGKRIPHTDLPAPDMVVESQADGTKFNLANWLECIRDRKTPNANVRAGVEAANTSHYANLAMRSGKMITV